LGLKALVAPRLKENVMKKLIWLLVIAGVLLAGCTQPSPSVQTAEPPPELYDKVWISPGKVEVGNFYPGARAEYSLKIHNGKDEPAEFSVTYRQPDSTGESYVRAPDEAQQWVIIADPAPVLAAKETQDVLIAVAMPKGAKAPPKWEFWISVKDATQTGMVQTELVCRWLVTMRE
jgi:hypothetical protein